MRLIVYDCENCYNQEIINKMQNFKGHDIVFIVGKEQVVHIPEKNFITIIRAKEICHNHADFIAVTELTRRLHMKKYQSACIITHDKGFNGAIDLLKEYGFSVNRYSLKDFVIKYINMFESFIDLPGDKPKDNQRMVIKKQSGYKPSLELSKYNIKPRTASEKVLISAILFVNKLNKYSKENKTINEPKLKTQIKQISTPKYENEVFELLKKCHIIEDEKVSLEKSNIMNLCLEGDKILSERKKTSK